MNRPIRVVLDINIWISYLISKQFMVIDKLLSTEKITLIFSNESLEEFMEVVKRPKFEKYFGEQEIADLLILFDYYGQLVPVSSKIEICRDPKDNFLLALAKDGDVDYLITGDQDLLEIETYEKSSILTFGAFLEKVIK
jgi:hypothetical protein